MHEPGSPPGKPVEWVCEATIPVAYLAVADTAYKARRLASRHFSEKYSASVAECLIEVTMATDPEPEPGPPEPPRG